MKTLRVADSADAIVDGLRWRRAEPNVLSSLRPLSVTSRCRRRIKRICPAHVPQRPLRLHARGRARLVVNTYESGLVRGG